MPAHNWTSSRDELLVVRVPDETTRQWIQQEYTLSVRRFVSELNLPVEKVEYSLVGGGRISATGRPGTGHTVQRIRMRRLCDAEPMFENPASWLNPRLTFDTYVVGSCNQLAHAAATAVAKMPSRSYNPLFIYGGTGIGKTHLMHAIGRSLLDNYGRMNIVYTSSERFMNEMIACHQERPHALSFTAIIAPPTFCSLTTSTSRREGADAGRVLPHFQ